MTPEDALDAAARTIGEMPADHIRRKFAQLQEAREARGEREALRRQAEAGSLELDEAAYQAGFKHEEEGDLKAAARWYRGAAASDFPGASLRLAIVLDALAAEHHAKGETQAAEAVNEDAREWAAKAFAAGEVGASRLMEELDARMDPARPRAQAAPAAPASASQASPAGSEAPPGPGEAAAGWCSLGGLRQAAQLDDAAEMYEHCRSCGSCQAELAQLAARWAVSAPLSR